MSLLLLDLAVPDVLTSLPALSAKWIKEGLTDCFSINGGRGGHHKYVACPSPALGPRRNENRILFSLGNILFFPQDTEKETVWVCLKHCLFLALLGPPPRARFLSLGSVDIWGLSGALQGSNVPGLYPLNARSTLRYSQL